MKISTKKKYLLTKYLLLIASIAGFYFYINHRLNEIVDTAQGTAQPQVIQIEKTIKK